MGMHANPNIRGVVHEVSAAEVATATDTSSTVVTFGPPAEPDDFAAARALGDAVATFNAGADTRNSLSASDQEALHNITRAASEFSQMATQAPQRTEATDRLAEMLTGVALRYTTLSTGVQTIVVGLEEIKAQAVESGSVRAAIQRCGVTVIEGAAKYIAGRLHEVATEAAKCQAQDEGLQAASRFPLVRASIALLMTALDANAEHAGGALATIHNAAYAAIGAAVGIHQRDLPEGVSGYSLRESVQRQHSNHQKRETAQGK